MLCMFSRTLSRSNVERESSCEGDDEQPTPCAAGCLWGRCNGASDDCQARMTEPHEYPNSISDKQLAVVDLPEHRFSSVEV